MSTEKNMAQVLPRLSAELGISAGQVAAVAKLLDEGNTIPFIARYRKEAHGNLDEVQISKVQERLAYYTELEDRRATILKSIDEQGKLTFEISVCTLIVGIHLEHLTCRINLTLLKSCLPAH